jgi:surface polysaccharide O-acyltransferase-like enzyme
VDANVIESRPMIEPKAAHIPHQHPQWMHYGDIIRILGTVVVVIGHVCDMELYNGSQLGTLNWHVLNVWDSFSRWAVPIYIMLSGSLLLDPHRTEAPSKFYHKRLMRIGVPLVFWSFFFMWLDVYYTGWRATHDLAYQAYQNNGWVFLWSADSLGQWFHNLIHYNPDQWAGHTRWEWFKYLVFYCPQKAWMNLLRGEPYMHMHFIFRIAGLYAFTPVLRVCLKHIPRPMLIATVVMMLIWSSLDSIANNVTETELSAFARFVPFLGYYLIGYLLREAVFTRQTLLLCGLGWLASVVLLAGGEELLVKHYVIDAGLKSIYGPPAMDMILYDFLSPVRVMMAIFAWIVLVNIFRNPWPYSHTGRSVIRFWANTTLGLYLIHPLFREIWYIKAPAWIDPYLNHVIAMHGFFGFHQLQLILKEWMLYGINATWPNVWVGVPMVAVLVYVPALLSTIVIMRIPYVRRIAG